MAKNLFYFFSYNGVQVFFWFWAHFLDRLVHSSFRPQNPKHPTGSVRFHQRRSLEILLAIPLVRVGQWNCKHFTYICSEKYRKQYEGLLLNVPKLLLNVNVIETMLSYGGGRICRKQFSILFRVNRYIITIYVLRRTKISCTHLHSNGM